MSANASGAGGGWRLAARARTLSLVACEQAAASGVSRRREVPSRQRAAGRDSALQHLVRALGASGTARVDHPPARLTRGQRGKDATTVGEAHQVVEVVDDVSRLQLAVHGADALGDLVVVAVGGRDTRG